MRKSRNARRRGFTLISLLVTLAVIAITMALGGPALLNITYEIKLKNAARETVSGMRAVRYRAINESREFGFTATPGSTLAAPGILRLFEGDDPTDVNAIIRDIPLPGGVNVSSSVFGSDTFVIFSPDGSAGNEGDVILTNANNHSITVSLRPAPTARMQISKIEEIP